MAATLDTIHSGMQLETWEDGRMEDRRQPTPTEGRDPGGQRRSTPESQIDPSNQSAAAGSEVSHPNGPGVYLNRGGEPDRSSGSLGQDDASRYVKGRFAPKSIFLLLIKSTNVRLIVLFIIFGI